METLQYPPCSTHHGGSDQPSQASVGRKFATFSFRIPRCRAWKIIAIACQKWILEHENSTYIIYAEVSVCGGPDLCRKTGGFGEQ